MDGVLVVDKPKGPTSFDIVSRVRHVLRLKKVGHTGTLDPMATGVLPLCLGAATKVAGYITEGAKRYEAVVALGVETDTYDAEGDVVAERAVPQVDRALLENALARFRGPFEQLPPMYSAVKVQGRRLYELARAGETVERVARPVTVYTLELLDFSATQVALRIHCSKGFFVRSLAHELGLALGCGGHLASLRRTQSGPFTLDTALTLPALEQLLDQPSGRDRLSERLVSMADALAELPVVEVTAQQARFVGNGVPLEGFAAFHGKGKLRVIGPGGQLLAVAMVEDDRRLRYARVLQAVD